MRARRTLLPLLLAIAWAFPAGADETTSARPIWPASGPVTSGYLSMRKVKTNNGWQNRPHRALDIGVGTGTPIQAVEDGEVVEIGNQGRQGRGKYVVIRHADGWETQYFHLSAFKVGTREPHPGETIACRSVRVRRGDIIGLSGATGNVTGPHLHLRVTRNGQIVNPTDYIRAPIPMEATGVVKVSSLARRKNPTSHSDLAGTLKKGTRVRITGKHSSWLEIADGDGHAWVLSAHVGEVTEEEPAPLAPEPLRLAWGDQPPLAAFDLCPAPSTNGPVDDDDRDEPETGVLKGRVTAAHLNVRGTPSTKGRILDVLDRGETVEVVGEEGEWLHVRTTDPKIPLAWVHKSHVDVLDPEPAAETGIIEALRRP